MSLPVQVGDIVAVFNAIIWIKQNCFDPDRQAARRYHDLKCEITSFDNALRKYDEIMRRRPPRINSVTSRDIGPGDLGQEYNLDLRGFQRTLEECQSFLVKNSGQGSNPLASALWHFRVEDKAEEFKKRIQAHRNEIALQIGFINLDFTDSLHELTTSSRKNSTIADDEKVKVPKELEAQFACALSVHRKVGATSDTLPLVDCLDVVHKHIIRSNPDSEENINSGRSPSNRYMSLLKAKWLLEVVQKTDEFKQEPRQSTRRHWVIYTESTTIPQRAELFQAHETTLETLKAEFEADPEIWITQITPSPDVQETSNTQETHIATIEMSDGPLQITQVGENMLRLNPSRIVFFNTHEASFVPLYTINPEAGVMLKSSMKIPSENLSFVSKTEMRKLQSVLVGYEVCKYRETKGIIQITINSAKQYHQKGVVQLWQWASQSATRSDTSTILSRRSSSSNSSTVPSIATTVTGGLNPSIYTFHADTSRQGGVIVAEAPPPPLLMCFTEYEGEYFMWRIDLTGVEITEQLKENPRITIKRKNDKLSLRCLSARASEIEQWNLCSMLPSHPQFLKGERVEFVKASYVVFGFPSIEKRNSFAKEFRKLLNVRKHQLQALTRGEAKARSWGNKINHSVDSDR